MASNTAILLDVVLGSAIEICFFLAHCEIGYRVMSFNALALLSYSDGSFKTR
ncbi:Uncharacterised protein [Proteus mirabilis]|uniref:Uncharacterized protein n=1 Tax=Proteus mirabilis TaxID=584 RepID=A0A2X2BFH6_PROMI|nr:Uncharacterised protein [Proteus mirabilis]